MINDVTFSQTNPTSTSPRNSPSLSTEISNVNNELTKIEQSIQDGFYTDSNTVARVSTASFTVLTDRTGYYTVGRQVRMNGSAFATVISSSYNSGTGLTTVLTNETTVPNPLTSLDIALAPKGDANPPSYGQTLTNPSVAGGTFTKPILSGRVLTSATYTPGAGTTVTLNCAAADRHIITMPAGNVTIALSNVSLNQPIIIEINQDPTGGRTVTWFSGISWPYSVVPTLTTTGSKRDKFGILCTGTNLYDGNNLGLSY